MNDKILLHNFICGSHSVWLGKKDNQLIYANVINAPFDELRKMYPGTLFQVAGTDWSDYESQFRSYFTGQSVSLKCEYTLVGTEFQKSVWKTLETIPYGELWTYKEVATAMGIQHKVRAVANAIGRNPLLIIIPCHRVVGSDNKLHGFRSGVDLKQQLITLENAKRRNT